MLAAAEGVTAPHRDCGIRTARDPQVTEGITAPRRHLGSRAHRGHPPRATGARGCTPAMPMLPAAEGVTAARRDRGICMARDLQVAEGVTAPQRYLDSRASPSHLSQKRAS